VDANEQSFRLQNPFVDLAISLVPKLIDNIANYGQASCTSIQQICEAGMTTCDMLNTGQPVSVILLLNNLWQMFWSTMVVFDQTAITAVGTNAVTITSGARTILNSFTGWDNALQSSPFSSLSVSFCSLLQGVTP
jgi:hypothetical protein